MVIVTTKEDCAAASVDDEDIVGLAPRSPIPA